MKAAQRLICVVATLLVSLVSSPLAAAQNHGAYAAGINYPAGPPISPSNTGYWFGGVMPLELHYGDFNGDGKVDVVVAANCEAPYFPACPATNAAIVVYLSNGDGTFQSPIVSGGNIPPSLRAMVLGDFNGDGKPDVAVAADCLSSQDCTAGSVTILLGNGDGTFTQSSQSAINGIVSQAGTLAVGDFNSDGKLDLAVGVACYNIPVNSCNVGAISVYPGNGNGTLANPTVYGTVGNNSLFPIVGDFNGDGKPDIIAGCSVAPEDNIHSSLTVLLNNGSGAFSQTVVTEAFSSLSALAAVDLKGAGKLDLVVTTPGFLQVLYANGNGSFQTPVPITDSVFNTVTNGNSIAVTDMNHDGKLDVIVSGTIPTGTNGIQLLLNDGQGNLTAGPFYGLGGYLYAPIVAQDFNGDGNVDVVLASGCSAGSGLCSEGDISILLGNADGTMQGATILTQDPNQPSGAQYSAITADVNGDGIPDLIESATLTNGEILVYLGTGNGDYAQPIAYPATAGAPYQLIAGDLNGDGRVDIAVVSGCFDSVCTQGGLSILLGNGNGSFQSPVSYSSSAQTSMALATGDFNGDGKTDIAVMNQSASVSIFFGNGNGTFQSAVVTDTSAGGNLNLSIVAADFNKDGKAEIALESIEPATNQPVVRVYSVGANGSLSQIGSAYSSGGGPSGIVSLATGYVNGDSNLDIVIANQCQAADSGCAFGSLAVLLGNGNGTFQTGTVQNVPDGNFYSLLLADISGDGILDAIATNLTGAAVLLGKGDGTFQSPTFYAGVLSLNQPTTAALADLDIIQPGVGLTFNAIFKNKVGTYLISTSSNNPTAGSPTVHLSTTISASYLKNVTPTGSISYYEGANLLGSNAIAAGAASLTISGLSPGVHTIRPYYSGDSNFNPHFGTAVMQVVNGPTLQSIAVTPASSSIAVGNNQQFTATGSYSDNSTQNLTNAVTWSSTNTGIATISASGLAMGVSAGQTTIQASSASVSGSTTLNVSGGTVSLSISMTGTSNGTVSDGSQLNCTRTGGVVSGTCSANYPVGSQVTLTATAPAGSIFFGWTGACTGSGPCVLTMNSNQAVTAKFSPAGASGCAPGDSIWIGGASGNWSVAANWSTGVVPNGTAHVCINNATSPASAVTLNTSVAIGGLTIDPGNSLTIANGQELNVSGTISNAGEIVVLASGSNTLLTFNAGVILTGGGTLTLKQTNNSSQPILRNSNNGTVTNVNNLIQGAGQFGNNGLVINNQAGGVINANGLFVLQFNSGTVTNAGLIEATAGGKLNINVTVVNQSGTITSTGANSVVQFLSGTTIQGGTVSNAAGGVIGNPPGNVATLDGTSAHGPVTIAGTYTDDNGGDATLAGTITNTGVLLVTSSSSNTLLDFSSNVILNGGGTVTLAQSSNGQPILRNVNNGILNNVNNLIQGSGQIGNNGLIINNQPGGVINANGTFPLQFNAGTVTNQNLIEATAGGTLQVSVLVINNSATLLSTGANSAIQLLGGANIRGGTFSAQAGGFIGGLTTVTLDGATSGALTLVGTYVVSNGTDTVLVGTINNTGVIQVPANNANTLLDFSGPVTLTGGGTISMPQSTSNGQPVLRNQNNGILNNVNNLIQGSGQIGNNGLIINNQPGGVINANGTFPLAFNSGTVTNQNLIEATAGGTLQVFVLVINNGATLLSTGANSAIQLLGGANIRGGTFSAQAGGFIGGLTTVTLDGATAGALTLAGTYVVSNGTDTVLVGTINNTGVIQVPANNANTLLDFSGPVTLTGGGTISMPQSTSNGQPVLRNQNNGILNNVNNLIQGSGQIGNNGLIINNQASGIINANGAFPLLFNAGTVTNLNLIEATGGGTLQTFVTVINKNATLLSTGANPSTGTPSAIQLMGGAIEGGTFKSQAGGFIGGLTTVTLDGTTQGALTLAGTYVVSNGTDTVLVGTINNTGVIQVPGNSANTFLDFNSNVTLTGGGTITMTQSTSNGQPILRNQNNGVLNNVNNLIQGSGQIGNNGLVVNNGPAGIINSNGAFVLTMTGATFTNQGLLIDNGVPSPGVIPTTNYNQASMGRLEVTITAIPAGPQTSVLQNSGTATLSGNLDVVFHGGYVPTLGDHFTVLTSNAINGQFAAIDSPGLPAGLAWSATYSATSAVITVVTAAGGSATLTVTDLGAGSGTVTDDLGLISCTTTGGATSGTCSASYGNGAIATLTATPAAGSDFTGWNACAGTGQCSVTLNGNQGVSATFAPTGSGTTLNVTLIGTGNGTVTDNFQQINCTNTAGVTSGTCSANYPPGTIVNLSASTTQPSTFGGWMGACTGTGACSVTLNSSQAVTASFVPPPQILTLPFSSDTPTGMATFNCPSNPNPTPENPCLDPDAHAVALGITQVNTPFTLTVQATEVPPNVADGLCPSGATPAQDFDCRFKSFFTYQTLNNGDTIVPLCYPFANGNCVHYTVFYQNPGTEPDPSWYTGPVNWTITWNNDHFIPPAPYTGGTPRLYDDPDGFVMPNSPYGTDCSTPMLIGNPGTPTTNPAIFCQFVFDITTFYDPNKKVDAGIGGKTKVFNDVVVAIPPANAGFVTVTSAPNNATVTAGSPIGFTITIANTSAGTATNATLVDLLPAASGLNWSISPAYTGPGTCLITGAVGNQALNCSFGNVAANTPAFSVHILSPSSSVGPVTNSATVVAANQQVLSIASVTVQAVTAAFSGLTQSQSITVGTSAVTLGGIIGGGNAFPAPGETVSIAINGISHPATIGSGGAFSLSFPTAAIPASPTAYPITYSFPGDSTFGPASDSSTALTVNPVVGSFSLSVTLIGTGNGTVTDNFQQINCTNTAGVTSGTCSANYTAGTVVNLTASATQPSTFGGWLGVCAGTGACSVTLSSSQAVTASFVPPPQVITLPFAAGTTSGMATYDCPSNPNPTPANPCLDPNAHAVALDVSQVTTPFTLSVQATEVPPNVADGLCSSSATPAQDFDCRFKSFFTYQTVNNGAVVPLCYPYANGNCVHYTVFYQTPGTEPDPSWYTGPVNWTITWNKDHFIPPVPYTGGTPRLYDDPDGFVMPNSPYGTDCSTPMLIGNPGTPTMNPSLFCQFVFDITTFYDPNKKVDAGIGGKTKVFNDVVVAIPPANAGFVTVTSAPDNATVEAGSAIGFTITIANTSAGTATNATLSDLLPAGANVNWSITPAYTGPGTCSIAGAVGTQTLTCSFGNVAANATPFSVHVLSASSSAGTYFSASTVTAANQQVLSIANVTVQALASLTFSALTPSQSITYGTATITLAGKLSSGNSFPASGENVTITIGTASQQATIGSNGMFTTSFPTATIPVSATAYAITYSFAGDTNFGPVSNASTTLTVTIANQTVTFGTTPTAAAYGSTFSVSASASSGLPVTIGASGVCTISGSTVTMTAGAGTCTLTAMQAGNANYKPVSAMKTVTATKANGTATIVSNTPNPSNISQAVTISVSVTGVTKPTGTVSITATTGETCNAMLSAGNGSCMLIFVTAGPRTITASYPGDANFNPTTSTGVTQTVNSTTTSALTISPSSVDFGQVLVGSLGVKTVTLTNTGATSIKISNVAINKPGFSDNNNFYALPLCPSTLAAKKTCTVLVTFIPFRNQSGPASASLVVTDNAVGSPQKAALTATAINPKVSLNPGSLSFGTQKVGTTSGVKSVTLTNSGTTPLILGSLAANGDFSISSTTTCTAGLSIAPAHTCRIDVKFAPKSKGPRFGSVTIKDNALFSPQSVLLSGHGN